MFCDKDEHYSDGCNVVTDIKKQKKLLKKNRLYFNCLKGDHQRKNCKVKIKCFKCKKEGNIITPRYVILIATHKGGRDC